jgi:xanthine dehydrogenase YagR molybdenum-binding subunit
MSNATSVALGDPLTRVDGPAKVTGAAKYAAEFSIPGMAYAALVMSTVPSGRISRMDVEEAERAPGVIAVITPANAIRLAAPEHRISLLQHDEVFHQNQPIGVVVAETIEQARHAASLVRPHYENRPAKLDFLAGFPASYPSSHNNEPGDQAWGDVDAGLAAAEVKIDELYTTPIQHHNPMEPHATTVRWDGDHLLIHDATQHITGLQEETRKIFGIPKESVHVVSPFVGGGFGCKGQIWSHVMLAALAAKQVKRPVRLALERPEVFGPVGARPLTHQQLTLGATRDGKLTAIRHQVHCNTSVIEDYLESAAFPTRAMYECKNISTTSRLVQLNFGTPTYTRAPGVATGTYAIEVAMDELAYKVGVDPLELRLRNYAEVDPHSGQPFTSKHLRECYQKASERFGWAKRTPEPRSMKRGRELIGWGMATETYPAKNLPASALVRFQPDGRIVVASGTQEIGTGNYTVLTEVAASILKAPASIIDARLGDTDLPSAPISAGSMSTASVGPAVQAAAESAVQKLMALASGDRRSPLHGSAADDLEFEQGKLTRKSDRARSESFGALLRRNGNQPLAATASVKPQLDTKTPCHSFGAIFAEVSVDADFGMTRVKRVVAVFDVGRIVNRQMARSQFIGGIVWGISLALLEDTRIDWRYGRVTNANLADYLLPVNADIPDIDVEALDIPDYKLDSLGVRGIGEIGITGAGAAICNAIYHATGKRVRDLPVTPDKLV